MFEQFSSFDQEYLSISLLSFSKINFLSFAYDSRENDFTCSVNLHQPLETGLFY